MRDTFGTIDDVQLVDPRNTAYIVPTVYRDARWHGATRWHALVEAVRATSPLALIVDGKIVSRRAELTPGQAVNLVTLARPNSHLFAGQRMGGRDV